MQNEKQFFFGFEVQAPWPEHFPNGQVVGESFRHMAALFLGKISQNEILNLIDEMPRPPFKIGMVGIFDACVFLPESDDTKGVAWKGFLLGEDSITPYAKALSDFFRTRGVSLQEGPFFPYMTIAKSPFKKEEWERHFSPLPYQLKALHLYESLGSFNSAPIWSVAFLLPFQPLDHTADVAFKVRAREVNQLYMHAQMALAFECPDLVSYLDREGQPRTLEDVIIKLNDRITQADEEIGVPLKAVSFHGNLIEKNQIFKWEMIVDV